GLTWKRWGTHPGGQYSSGFEEEYERAHQRKQKTGKPEIWLAFKKVPQDQLNDPGDQLKKVLAFKQAENAARRVLYHEFNDEEHWVTRLRGWLTNYIAQLVNNEIEELKESLQQPPQGESSTPVEVINASLVAVQASDSVQASASVSVSPESVRSAIPPQL